MEVYAAKNGNGRDNCIDMYYDRPIPINSHFTGDLLFRLPAEIFIRIYGFDIKPGHSKRLEIKCEVFEP